MRSQKGRALLLNDLATTTAQSTEQILRLPEFTNRSERHPKLNFSSKVKPFKRITSHALVEAAEAAGLAAYLAIGFAGMILGGQYLRNVIPLGTTGYITSGGTIQAASLATAVEVTGGFVLLLYAFLEQTIEFRLRKQKP